MTIEVVGRMVEASNATFLAVDDEQVRWVYKPVAGERRLWDFPEHTLGRREVAAFALSEALGLGIVPETRWAEGPLGEGSLQRFVDGQITDTVDLLTAEAITEAWLPVATGVDEHGRPVVLAHRDDERLRRIALFDALLNNSDRKVGHLIEHEGRMVGVDHGVALHVDDKLRTVLWGFAGEPLTTEEIAVVERAAGLAEPLAPGLTDAEWERLADRAARLLEEGVFPSPTGEWPAIPWPPW